MSLVSQFPSFSRLNLLHKDLLRVAAKRFPPYSDFNFVSLFTWDTDETIAVAKLHSNLVVRFSDYRTDNIFLSLLGDHMLAETLATLFIYCHTNHLDHSLHLIPHSVIAALPQGLEEKYVITEDRDDHDYIVSTAEVGNRGIARNKRRAYDNFLRQHGENVACKTLDLQSADTAQQIDNLVSRWIAFKTATLTNKKEMIAIQRCLKHARDLNIEGYGVYAGDQLIAFVIFEIASEATAMLHYGKADHEFPGAFDYIKIELAKHLATLNVKFMNIEQDLGIEGLRADKQSYKPIDFLKKYTISEKT